MTRVGAAVLSVVSLALCLATGRWWLVARRRDGYGFDDRKIAMSLVGLGVMGIVAAVRLLS